MGVVWRATDVELGRTVAVKQGEQIRREARVGAGLLHPNVIAVFTVVDVAGERLLVMEYLESKSLRALLTQGGPLPVGDVAKIGAQIGDALATMHTMRMVHRDISPGNVLVTEDRTAKLTDFGIAVWESVTETGEAAVAGTQGFMAPEVAQGHPATAASDVYSLGMTLSVAVEGTDPGRLGPVLGAMTDKDPKRRPTAERARQMLSEVAAGRHRGRWIAAGVGGAVVVAAVTVWLLLPPPSSPKPPAPQPQAQSLVGDPATADPCALTDPNALSRFGDPDLAIDYGNFNRCDALVYLTPDQSDMVDVRVELDLGQPSTSQGVTLLRLPLADGQCQRMLQLPGGYQVVVGARHTRGDKPADLCAMADAITSSAQNVLAKGTIPRRQPLGSGSLARLSACSLLDNAQVKPFVGGPTVGKAGFANWDCTWAGPGDSQVAVIFDRNPPLVQPDDGTEEKVGGRDAFVQAQGYGAKTCETQLVYRSYQDANQDQTEDVVLVVVTGDQPPQQLCTPANSLATTVATRLH